MNIQTRFVLFLQNKKSLFQKKTLFLKKKFLLSIFSIFFGFILGNIFGTFLNYFRNFFNLDIFIILSLLFVFETINYTNYSAQNLQSPFMFIFIIDENKSLLKILNYIKIGIMLGFFIDAFKVGS